MKSILVSLVSLWGTMALIAQPQLVKDINQKSEFTSGSFPWRLTKSNNSTLLFAAAGTSSGIEIWRSDGTEAGTTLVKDINPGSDGSLRSGFVFFKGKNYFAADDGAGSQLWKTDGTEAVQ